MWRVIITLPTSNAVVHNNEKKISGGFSSVNTRLAFDTEMSLPNLINQEKSEAKSEKKSEENEEFRKNYGRMQKIQSRKISIKSWITQISNMIVSTI